MSAWIVNDMHIDYILSAYEVCRFCPSDTKGDQQALSKLGQMLIDANIASFVARYGDNRSPQRYTFRRIQRARIETVPALKACDCFDGAACEVQYYEATEAAALILRIRRALIYELPGYDAAPWGFDSYRMPNCYER
jgi:hypothetical protein